MEVHIMANNKNSGQKKTVVHRNRVVITKTTILQALSYIGMVVSALMVLIGGILNLCNLGEVAALLTKIASILMLVAIAWPAWDFCRGKALWLKYLYFVALVLYILGAIFGFLML